MASGSCGAMNKEIYRAFIESNNLTQKEAALLFANEVARSGRRWALERGPPFAVALLIELMKALNLSVAEVEAVSKELRSKMDNASSTTE